MGAKMTKCLIVDDSPTIRKLIRRIVSDWRFECHEAEHGESALKLCKEHKPDLIFLDWNMPVMTGIEFLEILRASETDHHPTVLFCTTESGFEFIQRGMKAGADEYIMKPFDKDVLSSKLEILGFHIQ
jgi:two-component system, chemotaxis family, chemotaxis protein CheY